MAFGLSQLTSIRWLVYSNRRFLSTVLFTKYSEIKKIPQSRGVNWHEEYRCKYKLPSLYRYFSLLLARRTPMQTQITQFVSVFFFALGTQNTDANTYYPVCIGIFLCSRHERHRCKHTIPSLYRYYSLLLARRIPMQIQITQSVSVFCPAILNFPTKILVNSPLQQKNRKHQIAVGVCGSFFIKLPLTSSLPWPCSCQR